ncbi:MAG: efflux RND transporter periplasmic adaptor subunit [Deltaproteobacteria bacterium]|nr:efflux RND transporter periplasmic adaptor subunit [Deltaproteobacteria bacterium]
MNNREEKKDISALLHYRWVFVFIGLLMVLPCACQKEKPAEAVAPQVVEVLEVIKKDVPIVHEWVGSTDGLVNAAIRAQVTGYLIKQAYTEGDLVKKDDVLFEIDPRPFQQTLDQAMGTLAQLEAQQENARATLARVRRLAEQNALSPKDLDDATGAERSASAAVVAARAVVEKARLDLGFARVISPIDGMAGIARAQVGDLVGPSQGGELTTVSTIHPIKVYYTVNEQAYLDFMKPFRSEAEGLEQARKLDIELILGDGSSYPFKGKFAAFDRQIDVRTGTLRVQAIFPNPRYLLRPGQFVRVRVQSGIRKGALLIPQRAVTELQGSYQVAVAGTDNRVDLRHVAMGERMGSLWLIESGLKPGERVLAEGGGKVKQGMAVTPEPFALPAADPGTSRKPRRPTGPAGR